MLSYVLLLCALVAIYYLQESNVDNLRAGPTYLTTSSMLGNSTTLSLESAMNCILDTSHSQHFADIALFPLLFRAATKNGGRGTFVEIGALDGYKFSNSLMLETCFDWTGVLIEASKANFEKLEKSARKAVKVWSAICDHKTTIVFGGSGERASQYSSEKGGIQTPCAPLQTVVEEQGGLPSGKATFLSLDVEGAELIVIKTIDPSNFDVIFVEADRLNVTKDMLVKRHIMEAGLVFARYFVLGNNQVFVKPYLATVNCGGNGWVTHSHCVKSDYKHNLCVN